MPDNPKEAEKQMENEIPICGDCWLAVFNLVAPRQLGLEIALLSHRFDFYVDLHFRTRKWTFGLITICHKVTQKEGGGTTTEMQIFNSEKKLLPIPKKQIPNKVVGFSGLSIYYVDEKVADFLLHLRRLFATCATSLTVNGADNAMEFVVRNIWSIVKDNNACDRFKTSIKLSHLRQFAPSFLSDWPSLRTFEYSYTIFPESPADDSANASDEQAVAKWLFSPRLDGVPKVFQCENETRIGWKTKIEGIKTAFVNASTPVNFIFVFLSIDSPFVSAGEPFELTNNWTGERLVLKRSKKMMLSKRYFYCLCRCPISRDEEQWTKWEREAITGMGRVSADGTISTHFASLYGQQQSE